LNSTKLEKDYYYINTGLSKLYAADMDSEEIPDDINIHKKIWGKNADEVVYGGTVARKKGELMSLGTVHVVVPQGKQLLSG
jgi:hypothetical protein